MFLNNSQKLLNKLNKIYLLVFFFIIPLKFSNYVTITYLLLALVLIVLSNAHKNIKLRSIIPFIFLSISLLIVLVFSEFSRINTILCFLYLVICYFSYSQGPIVSDGKTIDWFYCVSLIAISVNLAIQLHSNGLSLNRFQLNTGAWDANISGVALFCLFAYCDRAHPKGIYWKVLAILVVFFSRDSRGTLLMTALFIIIKIFQLLRKIKNKAIPGNKVSLVFLLAVLGIVAFSYFWTYYVSYQGVVGYHSGLNDGSNAVRFRSNVYVINQLFSNGKIWFFGYDNDIQNILGDTDVLYFTKFENYRLVQSHNSILNMFIKNGAFFAITYFWTLLHAFKDKIDKKSLAFVIPFFVNAMILHSMLITDFILFFLLVLATQPRFCCQSTLAEIKSDRYLLRGW